jgi:hypothetical protein
MFFFSLKDINLGLKKIEDVEFTVYLKNKKIKK